jgi:hypothetical protein
LLTDSGGRVLIGENIITDFTGDKTWDFGKNFEAIVTAGQPTPSPMISPQPTQGNTVNPAGTPTTNPAPTAESLLLRTDKTLNAWEAYQGLASLTHINSESPPNYAFVAA